LDKVLSSERAMTPDPLPAVLADAPLMSALVRVYGALGLVALAVAVLVQWMRGR
jgi:hypothetical protein